MCFRKIILFESFSYLKIYREALEFLNADTDVFFKNFLINFISIITKVNLMSKIIKTSRKTSHVARNIKVGMQGTTESQKNF